MEGEEPAKLEAPLLVVSGKASYFGGPKDKGVSPVKETGVHLRD